MFDDKPCHYAVTGALQCVSNDNDKDELGLLLELLKRLKEREQPDFEFTRTDEKHFLNIKKFKAYLYPQDLAEVLLVLDTYGVFWDLKIHFIPSAVIISPLVETSKNASVQSRLSWNLTSGHPNLHWATPRKSTSGHPNPLKTLLGKSPRGIGSVNARID